MTEEPTPYEIYVKKAEQKLVKQAQNQIDDPQAYAMLALAYELHRANEFKEMELRMKRDELEVLKARL